MRTSEARPVGMPAGAPAQGRLRVWSLVCRVALAALTASPLAHAAAAQAVTPRPSTTDATQRIHRALHSCVEVKRLHPVRPGSAVALAEVQWCGRANTLEGLVLLDKERVYNLEDWPSDAAWARALTAAGLGAKSGEALAAFHAPVLLEMAADGRALHYARAFATCHACAVEAVGYASAKLSPRQGRVARWRIERVERGSAWPPPGAQAMLP